jgi:hypothetical protein
VPYISTPTVAIHVDTRDVVDEYGVTIDGRHVSDLVAFHDADEIGGNVGSFIHLAANIAVCGNQQTLTPPQVRHAATACRFPLIRI